MNSCIFISTLEYIPNYNISETKGMIYSSGNHISDNLLNLKQQASAMGCNSIINVKHMKNQYNQITTYGEAVILEKKK